MIVCICLSHPYFKLVNLDVCTLRISVTVEFGVAVILACDTSIDDFTYQTGFPPEYCVGTIIKVITL